MWETRWDDIKSRHNEIIQMISDYNAKIAQGDYLEHSEALDVEVYYNLLAAHVINLLIDDESLYLPNELLSILMEHDTPIMGLVEWHIGENSRSIKMGSPREIDVLRNRLVTICFNDKGKNFIQEVCAQDIMTSKELAKIMSSLLSSIESAITIEIKGGEEIFRQLSQIRSGNGSKGTEILQKFNFEYSYRGALIRGREFKHQHIGLSILEKVILSVEPKGALNYVSDKNFCQSAVLHIGIEETGSSGTGFKISEDGYALTCAHVVEGAKEICANVIVNDGYSSAGLDGFEVYDVGFGKVVYINKLLDIALVKTEYCGSAFLSLETRNILPELGEEVVVFGYPLGYEMPQTNRFGPNISFYKGYVSSNQVKDGNSITFLDIDVKSGNSGSPVISAKTGKVIGIISGIKVGGRMALAEKMPYMIPIQHFLKLIK